MSFIIRTLRTMFFTIDTVIYGLIDDVYGLLLQIARTSIFSQDAIHAFAERMYAFIGIFMLFKVSVSIINYVLNPDDFTDKQKGFSSIIKHVILSLVLVVLVPYVFNEAYELQTIILEENTIMNVIFGSPSQAESRPANSTYAETAGQKIQFTIMYAFAQPNYDEFVGDPNYDLIDCRYTYHEDDNGNYTFRDRAVFDNVAANTKSNYIYELNDSCFGTYNAAEDKYDMDKGHLGVAFKEAGEEGAFQNYAQGVAQQSFNLFFRREVILAKEKVGNGVSDDNARYLINYKMGISTAVGIGVLYLFLMFCIDIAARSVKLGFLQMISPIPIISYCDPKSGKDGMFSKWVKMCTNTYLELFIRLFALYFGIYVITLIGTFRDVVTGDIVNGWLLSIFMIIGVLIFIKKLPEILKEILNMKGNFSFTANPLKKLEKEALGGKLIANTGKKAVGVAAGVGVGAAAVGAGLVTGQGLRGKAMTKAISGGFKGEKFGKNFSNSYGAGRARKKQLDEMKADGVSPSDVRKANLYNAFHGQTKAEQVSTLQGQAKAIQSYYDQIKAQATSCDSDDTKTFTAASGRTIKSAKTISKQIDEMKKTTISRENFTNDADYQAAVDAQRLRIKDAEGDLEERINWLASGNSTGVDSADKVIRDAKGSIEYLKESSNELGKSLDSEFIEISKDDVVGIMKQAKGTLSQTTSGNMATMTDVGKYTSGKKK